MRIQTKNLYFFIKYAELLHVLHLENGNQCLELDLSGHRVEGVKERCSVGELG